MNKRPFGVGLLIAGIDVLMIILSYFHIIRKNLKQDGPHLYETCPDGNYYEYNVKLIIFVSNFCCFFRPTQLEPDLNQQEPISRII